MVELSEETKHLARRLIGLSFMGCRLEATNGRIRIETASDETSLLEDLLKTAGIQLRDNFPGGVLEALDTIDEALRMCGHPNLRNQAPPKTYFFGQPGIAEDRIARVDPGHGGIF